MHIGFSFHSCVLLYAVFLSGESPWTEEPGGGYSIWGCKESDTTEWLSTQEFKIKYSNKMHIANMKHFSSYIEKYQVLYVSYCCCDYHKHSDLNSTSVFS